MYSEEQIKNHQVFNTLELLDDTAQELIEDESIVSDQRETIERIKENGKYFQRALNNADPYHTPIKILKNLSSQLANVKNQLNSFSKNRNNNHLNSANTHIDNALVQLSNIPFSTDKVD